MKPHKTVYVRAKIEQAPTHALESYHRICRGRSPLFNRPIYGYDLTCVCGWMGRINGTKREAMSTFRDHMRGSSPGAIVQLPLVLNLRGEEYSRKFGGDPQLPRWVEVVVKQVANEHLTKLVPEVSVNWLSLGAVCVEKAREFRDALNEALRYARAQEKKTKTKGRRL